MQVPVAIKQQLPAQAQIGQRLRLRPGQPVHPGQRKLRQAALGTQALSAPQQLLPLEGDGFIAWRFVPGQVLWADPQLAGQGFKLSATPAPLQRRCGKGLQGQRQFAVAVLQRHAERIEARRAWLPLALLWSRWARVRQVHCRPAVEHGAVGVLRNHAVQLHRQCRQRASGFSAQLADLQRCRLDAVGVRGGLQQQ